VLSFRNYSALSLHRLRFDALVGATSRENGSGNFREYAKDDQDTLIRRVSAIRFGNRVTIGTADPQGRLRRFQAVAVNFRGVSLCRRAVNRELISEWYVGEWNTRGPFTSVVKSRFGNRLARPAMLTAAALIAALVSPIFRGNEIKSEINPGC